MDRFARLAKSVNKKNCGMSKDDVLFLFSLTVLFPAIAALVRFRKADRSYYPFLIFVIISLLNELLVRYALHPSDRDARTLNWQVFNLVETVLILLQFYYWKVFDRYKKWFYVLLGLTAGGWILENLVLSSIFKFNSVFLIARSFVIVLLSVQTINHIIVHQSMTPLTRNAMFIICVALVIYFIYNIFVFTLQAKGISKTNKDLMIRVFDIMVYVNAFSNIIYGIAVCLVPEKFSRKNLFSDQGWKN
jgi:hypothetical protein